MKLTSTLRTLVAGTAVLALSTWGILNITSTDSVAYQPRVERAAAQPDGALEIRKMLLADADGNIDHVGLQRLRRDVVKAADKQSREKSNSLSWFELGPDNIGGRTRAIVPVGNNTLYAGAVSGGLWKSTNRGDNWTQMLTFPSLMVGSMAVAGDGTLYVGTGSRFDGIGSGEGGSEFRGEGIWMSADEGASWTMVEGTSNFLTTDALVADPNQADRVWFGSGSGFGNGYYGFIVNGEADVIPGGASGPSTVTDIAIAPDGSYCLVAADNGRVYRSAGTDFTDLTLISQGGSQGGFLPQSSIGRARLDIAPTSNGDGTYNAFALYSGSNGLFKGLYFSGGNGEGGSWQEVWPEGLTDTPLPRSQGYYDLALGISKADPTLAYVGGIELWRAGPNQQAQAAAAAFDAPGFNYGVHADVHEIIFVDDNTTNGTMYVATDGGIYRSEDNGYSYTACNRDYNVTQFYGMAHSAGSGVLGGTQDNGSLFIPGDGYFLSDQMAVEAHGGDGFDCGISMVTEAPGHNYAWFAASQNGGLVRGTLSPGAVNNLGGFYDGNFTDLYNDDDEIGQFYTCIRLYEDFDDEFSQNNVILVNTFGQDSVGGTYNLQTNSQNLPFEYTMAADDTLNFYDVIVRPARVTAEPLQEDPDYFWLDLQDMTEDVLCIDYADTLSIDTVWTDPVEIMIDSTIVVVNNLGVEVEIDVQIPTGVFDSTMVTEVVCEEVSDLVGYDTLVFEINCDTFLLEQLDSAEVWVFEETIVDSTYFVVVDGDSVELEIEIPQLDSMLVMEPIVLDSISCDTTLIVEPVYNVYAVCDTIPLLSYEINAFTQCDTSYVYASDTLYNIPEQLRVKDPYNTMFAIGFNGSTGIWMTREALNFNTTPSWVRIGDAPLGTGTKAIEFVETGAAKGDVMFYTGWNGTVTRVTGLRDVYTQEDIDNGALNVDLMLASAGAAVTGLSVDPNDPNHVVVTVGGYGSSAAGKVRETFNALSPDFDPTTDWNNIWNAPSPDGIDNFASMPCYDVVIDARDASGQTIVVGTEFGIFVTEDGGSSWNISNMGVESGPGGFTAPVFDLKQQFRDSHEWSNVTNGGAIYAGTHGRGMFVNGIASSVEEEVIVNEETASWNVFPNPVVAGELNLPTAGWQGNAQVEIFDLIGRRWVSETVQLSGVERIRTDVQELPSGHYVVRMAQGGQSKAAKFVVRQ